MKNILNKSISILTLLLLVACPVHAASIVDIAVGGADDILFLLDDNGQVWAFEDPRSLEKPIKLQNLNHIVKLAPYVAIDSEGHVFTWHLHPLKSDWGPDGINEAVYTTPHRVENLQNVTRVASADEAYFVAVIGDSSIVDWTEVWKGDKSGAGAVIYGPIRKVADRTGVRSVAAAATSLVALFNDGAVMGWGVKSNGRTVARNAERQEILITQTEGISDVALNNFHMVVLSAKGIPKYWGGVIWEGRIEAGGHGIPGMLSGLMVM